MGSKRKRHHYRSSRSDRASTDRQLPKRPRLSEDQSNFHEEGQINEINGSNRNGPDEDGWVQVTSKSSKRGKDRQENPAYTDDYPRIRMHQNYQSEIRLKDLRDLSLYLLADEPAPKWMAISNSRHVPKVVVLMVPGMDEKVLRRAEKLWRQRTDGNDARRHDKERDHTDSSKTGDDASSKSFDVRKEGLRDQGDATENTQNLSWLFDHVMHVKGPGDSKMSKVHSPLQAMLLSQGSDKSQQSSGQRHTAERTPILEFVHTPDELREAEFPIHPATFTSALDLEIEAERRVKTGQSIENSWKDTIISTHQPKTDPTAKDFISQGCKIYSLDCEMVQTSDGANSLARISLIAYPDGKLIIDKLVKPDLPIKNYFTQYSGITEAKLENVTTTLSEVQEELLEILDSSAILLGHSLDSDLNAMKMTHPFLVDTSIIYPHPRGLPLRSSLKYLANKYLKREIQTGGAAGHNSVEDAQAVLDLVKLKCEKGPKWGTIEANGEPIFRQLKRNGRTSAMVEHGTPERGYGKEATHAIGCQTDDEVVQGVIRAIKGDDYFDFEIPAGGVDFVWGRLRALEYARGWVSGVPWTSSNSNQNQPDHVKDEHQQTDENLEDLDAVTQATIENVQKIYNALPRKALLIICSGTSDVRPVMKLQAQQQQYRKEFKVKKWDELTIKWTDSEEQALRRACEGARAGWGVCAIK